MTVFARLWIAGLLKDGLLRCGMRRCRGTFGIAEWNPDIDSRECPPGEDHETWWTRKALSENKGWWRVILSSKLVKVGEGSQSLYLEPDSRRKVRLRGLRSERHLKGQEVRVMDAEAPFTRTSVGIVPSKYIFERVTEDLRFPPGDLPVSVRCPRCKQINVVDSSSLTRQREAV